MTPDQVSLPTPSGAQVPLVSVIIPAFNAEKTILATVRSALSQTYRALEIIVVDDGSTDDTATRLNEIADPRLRVVRAENGGVSRARNLGLVEARGDLVSFLDADDLWTRNKVEAQLDALRAAPAAGAVYSWTAFIDDNDAFLFAKKPERISGEVYGELLSSFFLASGSNAMAWRHCLAQAGLFAPESEPVEDWEFWLRVAYDWPIALAPGHHVLYRYTVGSASAAVDRYLAAIKKVAFAACERAPWLLQRRRGECLANAHLHACLLLLARSTDPKAHQRTGGLIKDVVSVYPRVLVQPRMLALIGVWFVLACVPQRAQTRLFRNMLAWRGRWTLLVSRELRGLRVQLHAKGPLG